MLRTVRILISTALITSVALPAFALSPEAEKLAAAIEANGCVMNGETADKIGKDSGLDDAQGRAAGQELMKADRIEGRDDGFSLRSPVCDAKKADDEASSLVPPVAALTLAIKAADCKMTADNNRDVLEHSGLTDEAGSKALAWMLAKGILAQDGVDMKLNTEGCL